MARPKRKDKTRTVLRTGELQRSDGSYQYSWTDENHKRRYVYSKTLEALRIKEEAIEKDKSDGIKAEARYVTLDDLYELWKDLKRGLKNNTFENYKYIYETFVRRQIGSKRVSTFLKSDIKRFYNYLVDERGLKPATVDGVHNILHQIFDMAVDDNYIRNNPTNNVLRELKKAHCFKTEKRRGLTRPEQELFMDYLKNSNTAVYWYPVFAVMLGTGLRVGEVTGLRWSDIDLEDGIIDVNHTLVYYDHRTSEGKTGCYFNVNTTKTPAGMRQVPMLEFVKEAFLMEKERQELLGLHCEATVDGYTDFVFVNRFGQPQHQATLNKAIRRINRHHQERKRSIIESFFEMVFASTSVLIFLSLYYVIDERIPGVSIYWQKYQDIILLLFLCFSVILNGWLDIVFVPLEEIDSNQKASIRLVSSFYIILILL